MRHRNCPQEAHNLWGEGQMQIISTKVLHVQDVEITQGGGEQIM